MHKAISPLVLGFALLEISSSAAAATSAAAQVEVLREDFESGVVPPAGWSETRVSAASLMGWEANHAYSNPYRDSGLLAWSAWHDYGPAGAPDDNLLVSPPFSLSGVAAVWLHYYEFTSFTSYRDRHAVEVTLDGGATWVPVHESTAPDLVGTHIDVDLAVALGVSGVQIAFRYQSEDGARWYVDEVIVNDDPATPPPPPANWNITLPSEFVRAAGYNQNFDGVAGLLPPHIAVTENDGISGQGSLEAWCNVGQRGACLGGNSRVLPNSGAYHLEMGRDPAESVPGLVRNAIVFALDGEGRDDLTLRFSVVNHGEEDHTADGIWLSQDGSAWHPLVDGWSAYGPYVWQQVSLPLNTTVVDTSKKYYLMFAQEDDYALGTLDGVQVDDIAVHGTPTATLAALVAGQLGGLDFTDCSQNALILSAYSLAGAGPTPSQWGDLLLTEPYVVLAAVPTGAFGNATVSFYVPAGTTGTPIWFHAVDAGAGLLTNGIAAVVG